MWRAYRTYQERWTAIELNRRGLATLIGGAAAGLAALVGTEIGGALVSQPLGPALAAGGAAGVTAFIVGAITQRRRCNRRIHPARTDQS
jgi:hypothetical protein